MTAIGKKPPVSLLNSKKDLYGSQGAAHLASNDIKKPIWQQSQHNVDLSGVSAFCSNKC